ncbi:hypothetical protein AWW66_29145 [Micromonospora rosaria]|uniref:Uncharacterized protein n=1 Tax=Micromonospora rosaria TaxID=47874 RepID=A0A136PJM8_9ACTN|nr:hypothetical protein AWW66_29145 [Micromonospora rosaria]
MSALRWSIHASAQTLCTGLPAGLRQIAGLPQRTHGTGSPALPSRRQSREVGMMNLPFQAEKVGGGSGAVELS